VIRSYLAHTPALLESLRTLSPETLGDYIIKVHGIKGASYIIAADLVGRRAEELERAARGGDLDFVAAHNGEFLRALEGLLGELERLLEELGSPEERPEKAAPEGELLEAALRASDAYDIGGLEQTLAKLGEYRYQNGEELVNWLQEEGARSEFGKISRRLSEELGRRELN
jgi:hypothetical protein